MARPKSTKKPGRSVLEKRRAKKEKRSAREGQARTQMHMESR